MNNLQENKNLENIENSENLALKSQKEIFSEKIENLVSQNKFKNSEELIKRYLRRNIVYFLENENSGIFNNYNKESLENGAKRYQNKFEKYFPIHENIIYEVLNKELEKAENKDDFHETKNLISNTIKKYAYILFIFSEKIKLTDLKKYLELDITELSFIFSSAKKDIEILDSFWDNVQNKLKKRFDIDENEENIYADRKFFPMLYRRLYKKIEKDRNEKNLDEKNLDEKSKWEKIALEFENEMTKSFWEIFYIFETWIEFWAKDDEKIKNLSIFTRKIIEWILFLKREDMAFSSFKYKTIPAAWFIDEFIAELEKKYLTFLKNEKSDYKEDFLKFLKCICLNKNDDILKQELINSIIKKNKISAEKRVPEEWKENENLKVENVNFEEWMKIPESQKYKVVFSEVISKNWKINFSEELKFDHKDFDKLLDLYCEYYLSINKEKNKENFRETIKNQFESIWEMQGQYLENFIKNDVNNLNLLILWWRFILKTRYLEQKNLELNLENIKNEEWLKEKQYWIIEKISEKLKKENILPSENIIFSIDWKVRNTSIESEDIWLNELIWSLKKWFIDLSKEKIKLVDWKEKIIWTIQELFIPNWLTEKSEKLERDISNIDSHLNFWIDFCYKILQNKDDFSPYEKAYWEWLVKQKIIPENYNNLSLEEKESMQHLVEILKYIKSRVNILTKMMQVAQEDKKTLSENDSLQKLLSGHSKSNFWPAKAFNRAFIKLISEYGWNFNKLWDLTRARVVSKSLDSSIENVVDFIKTAVEDQNITNLSIVDSTGEPISIPKKPSWYRDIKLFLKMKSWNTVEVQFQINDMYEIKDHWIDLSKEENNHIFEKMKKEWSWLSSENVKDLLEIAKERSIDLPKKEIIEKLMIENPKNIDWEKYEELLNQKQITTDYSYHIVRQLDKDSEVRKKLTRLERILADSAWSNILIEYLKSKNIELK